MGVERAGTTASYLGYFLTLCVNSREVVSHVIGQFRGSTNWKWKLPGISKPRPITGISLFTTKVKARCKFISWNQEEKIRVQYLITGVDNCLWLILIHQWETLLTKSINPTGFGKGRSGREKKTAQNTQKALSLSQGAGSTSEADGKSSQLGGCRALESHSIKLKTSFSL